MAAHDQGFRRYKATLETTAAPYNPFSGSGSESDDAQYILEPGVAFMRPWIAVRNGPAFQWPLGIEGFQLAIDPVLGIHKFIGDNKVAVDVIHSGEEHLTLNGNFPGDSAPKLIQALRDLVYRGTGEEGKILYIPEVLTHAQRVQVVHAEFSRDQDGRGRDHTYSIEVVRIGMGDLNPVVTTQPTPTNPKTAPRGKSSKNINVDSKHNTLRKIAAWKLGSSSNWRTVYDANSKFFISHTIQLAKAPDYRLPTGMKVYY